MVSREETRIESREKTVTVYECDFCGNDGLSRGDVFKAVLKPRLTHSRTGEMYLREAERAAKKGHPSVPVSQASAVRDAFDYVEIEHDAMVHLCELCADKIFPDGDRDE